MIITAGKRSFQELNNEIRGMLLSEDMIRVEDVNGQRYIGAALDKGKTIEIHGTPGNDMGAYLNGGNIEVYGNGQEAVGNTMGGGSVTIPAMSAILSATPCATAIFLSKNARAQEREFI